MSPLAILAATPSRWKAIAAALALVPLIFALGRCDGIRAEKARQRAAEARQALAAERIARAADRLRGARLSADTATIRSNRKEVDDATAHLPDRPLSDRQRARALLELCRTGRAPPGATCGSVRAPGAAGDAR